MKIFIFILTLFFSTNAISTERLLCEIDKSVWGLFEDTVINFLNSEKFTPEKKKEFEKLTYDFHNIFWLEYEGSKTLLKDKILRLRNEKAYFVINNNRFGQFKSLDVEFNDAPIPIYEKSNDTLHFRAWPHRTDHGKADILIDINRKDAYIYVYSKKFNEFFAENSFMDLGIGWFCKSENINKF